MVKDTRLTLSSTDSGSLDIGHQQSESHPNVAVLIQVHRYNHPDSRPRKQQQKPPHNVVAAAWCKKHQVSFGKSLTHIPTELDYSLDRYISDKTSDTASLQFSPRQARSTDHSSSAFEKPQSLRIQHFSQGGLLAHIGAWTIGGIRYVSLR